MRDEWISRVFYGPKAALVVATLAFGFNGEGKLCYVTEDPFKLVILSKGRQNAAVSNANFFFGLDGQLSFIGAGEDGVLRAFEFLPHNAASDNGKKLMLRTEYHGQSEHFLSLTLPRRTEGEDEVLRLPHS